MAEKQLLDLSLDQQMQNMINGTTARYATEILTKKMSECLADIFENALVWVWLSKFCQALQDSRYLGVAWSQSCFKNFYVRIFFCAFLWQLYGSSEARPAFLRRAVHPKQCMNVEGKLFAKRPKGMLASGTSFRPPCFLKLFPILKIVILNIKMHVCVGRSNVKREIHFSNPILSLCLRM